MWGDSSFTGGAGGGFIPGNVDSPATGDKGKGRRNQNIFPVTCKQLVECKEDSLKMEGFEVSLVSLVGIVRAVEQSTAKVSMFLDDQTATFECVIYTGTDDGGSGGAPTVLVEGTYGHITGAFRVNKEKKYVLIYRCEAVRELNQITCHMLEVVQTQMKLKKLRAAEAQGGGFGGQGQAMDNSFSNSMIKGGAAVGGGGNDGSQIFTTNQNIIRRIIATARDEVGMHRDQIIAQVKNQIPLKEIGEILEFLSNEGHVYSTVDDNHFQVTDSQYT